MILAGAIVLSLLGVIPAPWNAVAIAVAAVIEVAETALFVWWSKRRRAAVGVEALVGRRAVAVSDLRPAGQVKLDGELWAARAEPAVAAGTDVLVRRVDGLTLHVEPAP